MTAPDPRPLRVLLAGGGTGGHIEPALNLADALRRHDPATAISLLGTAKGLETTIVPARGYDLRLIPPVPLPRRVSRDLLTVPRRLTATVRATRDVLTDTGADVVVGFGGYVSLPAYLAARRAKVPFVVHEANARAGLANRVGATLTPHVVENYAGSLRHAVRLGCPLRPAIATLDRAGQRGAARTFFGLAPSGPVLLAFGGSQGARSINTAVVAALPDLLDAGVQVLHAVGRDHVDPANDRPGYVQREFIDRMDLAYAAADVAVCRSGAMTCAEVAAVGLPCLYVPYPVGNGEQRLNALPVVRAGGGLMIDDAELTPAALTARVLPLLTDPAAAAAMGARAAAYGIADGADRLADLTRAAAGVTR